MALTIESIPVGLAESRVAFLPQSLPGEARQNMRLVEKDWKYRFTYVDRFTALPRDATTFELDSTTTATLEATAEVAIIANKAWMITGVSATDDDVTFAAEGGIVMQTDGTVGSQVVLTPQTEVGFVGPLSSVTWLFDNQPSIEAVIRRPSAGVDAYIVSVGFSDADDPDITGATDDACLVEITVTAAGVLTALFRTKVAGATLDETISLPAWAVDTVGVIRVEITEDRRAHVFFNGARVLDSTVVLATADQSVNPIVGIEQTAATASAEPAVSVHAVEVAQNYD